MASLMSDLTTHLVRRGIAQGAGVDVFHDYIPDSPDDIIVFTEYAGGSIVPEAESLHRSVQVKVRGKTQLAAKKKIWEIFNALNASGHNIQITPERWGQIYIRQSPFILSKDAGGRSTWVFNFGITTKGD